MLILGEIASLYIGEHEHFCHFNITETFWGELLSASNRSENSTAFWDYDKINFTDPGKTEHDCPLILLKKKKKKKQQPACLDMSLDDMLPVGKRFSITKKWLKIQRNYYYCCLYCFQIYIYILCRHQGRN